MWSCDQSKKQTSLSSDAQGDFATRRENTSANIADIAADFAAARSSLLQDKQSRVFARQ